MRIAWLLLVALLGVPPAGRAGEPEPLGACGPVARVHEAIEVPIERLGGRLRGTPIARTGLVAFRDGSVVPIPFQVDERRGNRLALPDGPEPTADDLPDALDGDDLLVFMACDAGARGTPEALSASLAQAGLTTWRELRLTDPIDGHEAYVYLVIADRPPLSPRRYVAYDAEHDIVSTARYRVGCVGALPSYFALALSRPLTGNLLDGVRLRADATVRGNLVHMTRTERDGKHRLEAWKVGPVRVIRRSRHSVRLGLGIYITGGLAHTFFYAQHVFAPGSMKLPFSPQLLFSDITAMGGADFRDLRGWRYHAAGTPADGFAVDGTMDARERAFAGGGDWFSFTDGSDAFMIAAVMSEELKAQIPLQLLYRDDTAQVAPPEAERGTTPLVGYQGRRIETLRPGRYWFQLRILGWTGHEPGDEARELARIASPLTADLTARSSPEAAPAPPR